MIGVWHAELLHEGGLMHEAQPSALIHPSATILHVTHPTMQ